MKTFTQFVTEAKKAQIEPQENCLNYISAADLKKYLEIANKFLSQETKDLIQWLIVNNNTYMKDLDVDKPTSDSLLASFYNAGPYSKDPQKKELFALIGKINKTGRLLEIPLFQTEQQFKAIITGKESPDNVILDFTSDTGRNAIAKKYFPLCKHIAASWRGKSNLSYEELLSAAQEGLVWAMNSYGKKSKKQEKREEQGEEELNIAQYKATTFLTFASYMIRFAILDTIKKESHTVSIPASEQSRERKEKGSNTKNRSVSGDKSINGEEGGKSLFDLVGGTENSASSSLEQDDIDKTWKQLIDRLKSCGKFKEKMIKCWIEFNGIGVEKRSNKELAKELDITSSNVTYYCNCINNYIRKDPKIVKIARELQTLYAEAKQRSYNDDMDEPLYVKYSNEKEDESY